jgi:S1-C subfamily serine protease
MEMIEPSVEQIIRTGVVVKSFMGITLLDAEDEIRNLFDVVGYTGRGAVVREVVRGSPAAAAGLQRFDIITHVDGQPISGLEHLRAVVSSRSPGESIDLRVWRRNGDTGGAQTVTASVALLSYDEIRRTEFAVMLDDVFGLRKLSTSSAEAARALGVPFAPGVLIEAVREDSPASGVLDPGTTIVGVDGFPVGDVDTFIAALTRSYAPRGVELEVVRPDGMRDVVALTPQ